MILRAVLLMALAAGSARAEQAPAPPAPEGPHDATAHHPFTDVDKWTRIFDDPKRDEWQKPKETVAALGLKPGQIVADLGAGTGYFERHLSRAVAPGGRVAIVDFHKRGLPVGPPPEHKLAREFVLDEMKQAGWRLAAEPTFLPYHYFLIFQPAPR